MAMLVATGIAMDAAHERSRTVRATRADALSRVGRLLFELNRVQREQRRLRLGLELGMQPAFWTKDVDRAIESLSLPFESIGTRELDRVAVTLSRAQQISAERTRLRIAALLDEVVDDEGEIVQAVVLGALREAQLALAQKLITLLRERPAGMSRRRHLWAVEETARQISWCRKGECCFFALDFDAEPSKP